MKYVPILFSTPMVIANLNGSKTQTRRIIKPQPSDLWMECCKKHSPNLKMFDKNGKQIFWIEKELKYPKNFNGDISKITSSENKPKAQPGDIFWVRETWHPTFDKTQPYFFKADLNKEWDDYIKWKPSIFMPKAACRIFLKVTNVRVESLHDISEEDAIAEGIECLWQDDTGEISVYQNYMATEKDFENDPWSGVADSPQHSFFTLWESINGKESLDSNPWLWVYNYERIEKPEGWPKI